MTQHRDQVPGKALGKRSPSTKPALMLADFLTGVTPPTPTEADHLGQISGWELGGNDSFGTCGPTSVANHLRMVSTLLATPKYPALDDVFDLYRRSGNPNFNPALKWDDPAQEDNGVDMQQMLGALLSGGIGGYRPLAFAKIAAGDTDTLDEAIAIFGGVLLGLTLQTAQQKQTTWDYSQSGDWGGHAVMAGRYRNPSGDSADRTAVVTWAEVVDMTRPFVSHQEDEAWVVIWPEYFGSVSFLDGVDVSALASAYADLTGRPFPVYQPPPPPGPSGSGDQALQSALVRMLKGSSAPKYLRTAAEAWLAGR